MKKIQNFSSGNNEVCLFEEMTNASALSEKKPPLRPSDQSSVCSYCDTYVKGDCIIKHSALLCRNSVYGKNSRKHWHMSDQHVTYLLEKNRIIHVVIWP